MRKLAEKLEVGRVYADIYNEENKQTTFFRFEGYRCNGTQKWSKVLGDDYSESLDGYIGFLANEKWYELTPEDEKELGINQPKSYTEAIANLMQDVFTCKVDPSNYEQKIVIDNQPKQRTFTEEDILRALEVVSNSAKYNRHESDMMGWRVGMLSAVDAIKDELNLNKQQHND